MHRKLIRSIYFDTIGVPVVKDLRYKTHQAGATNVPATNREVGSSM